MREGEPFDDYDRRVVEAILGTAGQWTEADHYHAILIYEGHDFEPDWLMTSARATCST